MSHVVVIVLGDLGRSPRMQFHAKSFATLAPSVKKITAIGYAGEKCISTISSSNMIDEKRIPPIEFPFLRKISFLHTVCKGIALMFALFQLLWDLPSYDLILIQNPPAIPVLIVAIFFSRFVNDSKVCVDWHNLGFSMFKHSISPSWHPLVVTSRTLECFLSQWVHGHICVSQAMQAWLFEHFHVRATVVYDRPLHDFCQLREWDRSPTSSGFNDEVRKRHDLLCKMKLCPSFLFPEIKRHTDTPVEICSDTLQTTCEARSGVVQYVERKRRVKLIVSSTSWTPDEDFNILLDAVVELDAYLVSHVCTKDATIDNRVVVIVTGKGPEKAHFEALFVQLNNSLEFVRLVTLWLTPEDYPRMISCADIGVCLHTSSSGLDLPMKVLDMFGTGVPVCAVEFPTLSELVLDGVNGLVFKSSKELCENLITLLYPHLATEQPDSRGKDEQLIDKLRRGTQQLTTWESNWKSVVAPLMQQLLQTNALSSIEGNRKDE